MVWVKSYNVSCANCVYASGSRTATRTDFNMGLSQGRRTGDFNNHIVRQCTYHCQRIPHVLRKKMHKHEINALIIYCRAAIYLCCSEIKEMRNTIKFIIISNTDVIYSMCGPYNAFISHSDTFYITGQSHFKVDLTAYLIFLKFVNSDQIMATFFVT